MAGLTVFGIPDTLGEVLADWVWEFIGWSEYEVRGHRRE
jgi:hypothetical protein